MSNCEDIHIFVILIQEGTDIESTLSDSATTIRDFSFEDSTLTSSFISLVDSTTIDDSFSESAATNVTTISEEGTSTSPSVTDITEPTLISLEAGYRETSCQENEPDKEHISESSANTTVTTFSSTTSQKENKEGDYDSGHLPLEVLTQVNTFEFIRGIIPFLLQLKR